MQIQWALLISRQGKVRLSKWYGTMNQKSKAKIVKDVTQLVLARRVRRCLGSSSRACAISSSIRVGRERSHTDFKIVYRRYASLFFVTGIATDDNELIALEVIHRYVEILDRYFGNVCELDL